MLAYDAPLTRRLHPDIGVLNSGAYYAFVNGHNKPETVGTREEVEVALGLRQPVPSSRRGRKTANGGWVLSFGSIKGKPLVCEISTADSVMAFVRCGDFECSLALLADFGTVGEDGPAVDEKIVSQMEIWAATKGW